MTKQQLLSFHCYFFIHMMSFDKVVVNGCKLLTPALKISLNDQVDKMLTWNDIKPASSLGQGDKYTLSWRITVMAFLCHWALSPVA